VASHCSRGEKGNRQTTHGEGRRCKELKKHKNESPGGRAVQTLRGRQRSQNLVCHIENKQKKDEKEDEERRERTLERWRTIQLGNLTEDLPEVTGENPTGRDLEGEENQFAERVLKPTVSFFDVSGVLRGTWLEGGKPNTGLL